MTRFQNAPSISQQETLSQVDKYQTVEKGRSLARRFAAEAHFALQLFPKSPFKEGLEAIPQFILDREK